MATTGQLFNPVFSTQEPRGFSEQEQGKEWLSRTIKEEKEKKKAKAFEMWLACKTQEEIAEAVQVPQQTLADWMKGFTENLVTEDSVKWHDFDPPIYNVWKQQNKSNKVNGGLPNILR